MRTPRLIILAFFALLPLVSYAQFETLNEEWRWVQFTTEAGLPSNQIRNIVLTTSGTVWAVTPGGLAWYDRYRWHAAVDLPAKMSASVAPTPDDRLIVVIDAQVYAGDTSGFRRLQLPAEVVREGIDRAVPLTVDQIAVRAGGNLYVWDVTKRSARRVTMPSPFATPANFFLTNAGSMWVSTMAGIYRWNGNRWELKLPAYEGSYQIVTLNEGRNGMALASIIFPHSLRGLWEWRSRMSAFHNVVEGRGLINAMDISPSGEAIVIYQSGDVRVYNGHHWGSLPDIPSHLRDVLVLKFESGGDLWVGTESGLYLYRRSSTRWTYWKHMFPNSDDYVAEILQARDGSVWLGTAEGLEVRRPDGSATFIHEIDGRKIPIITGLCEDNEGGIWISSGSQFRGAYRWNGSVWRHFGIADGLDTVHFHQIFRDRSGRIWLLGLGTSADSAEPGAYVYDGTRFAHWGTREGLLHGRVYSFGESRDGTLWFGTLKGLSRWRDGVWKYYQGGEELRGGKVFSIAVDTSGGVWFSDWTQGLAHLDRDDHLSYYTTADGLTSNELWDLKFDARGTLWISTRLGGGISALTDGVWSTLSLSTGLNNLRVWPLLPVGNRLYIGTDGGGVNVLDLSERDDPAPRITIDPPAIESKTVVVRWRPFAVRGELPSREILTRYRLDTSAWSSWSSMRELKLDGVAAGRHVVTVQAKGLFGQIDPRGATQAIDIEPPLFLRPIVIGPLAVLAAIVTVLAVMLLARKRRHAAALRKSEAQLRAVAETTSSAIIIFSDLRLLYANPSAERLTGYSAEELLTLQLADVIHSDHLPLVRRIALALRRGPGMREHFEAKLVTKERAVRWVDITAGHIEYHDVGAVLATATDITERKQAEETLMEYQGRLRSLANELSITEERERRRMATYLHDYIGQELAMCRMKLGSRGSAVTAEKLNDVRAYVAEAARQVQSLTFDLSPPVLYELGFDDAIEWLTEEFHTKHHLPVYFQTDQRPKPIDDTLRVVLFHTVRELLFNIVKHANAHSAKVTLSRQNGCIAATVQDDGNGFDPKRPAPPGERTGGFGLFNIRERLTRLGGAMNIDSEIGVGTTVTVTAPLSTTNGEEES
jgi:PAS domain S-box-containing protein